MQWPPDYQAEFARRLKNRNLLLNDEALRRRIMRHYKHNPIDWINDWAITFDPRATAPNPKLMPFILFPRQEQFITFFLECLNTKQHGLVEKARDMGVTWLCVALSVWLWLFWPGSTIGWGSLLARNIDDRGNPKAIFLKIRQTISYLPAFMRPAGFSMRDHAPAMKILHPTDTATIIGEGGDDVGRGGRTTIYIKDESAHYEHAEQIEAALGDNTDVQIDVSSVNGSTNVFYRRRMAGQVWYPGHTIPSGITRVFIFDWSEHPNKTQEWHDERERKARAEGLLHIFRQEVDRDYAGSVENIIIRPEWVEAAVDAHLLLKFGDDGERVAGQDVADGGGDKNALIIRKGLVTRHADDWGGEAGEAAKIAIPYCGSYGVGELYYDSIGVGAGFKTEVNHLKSESYYPRSLRVLPWNAGSGVLDPTEHIIPGDDQSPTNEDQYLNLKAQSWFRVRARFYKTYRMVKFGEIYPVDELISLDSTMPKLHELKMQLSQPTYKAQGKGKTVVDKKPGGAFSPNLADALVICYSPTRELSILDVL